MPIYFASVFSLAQAKYFEPEQANYYAMLLRRENTRRKDNLSFRATKTTVLDVMLNPLWTIAVNDKRDGDIKQFVRAIRKQS